MMFGGVVRGTQSKEGALLLAKLPVETSAPELMLAMPVSGFDDPRCLIATQAGKVFVHYRQNWMSENFWDVTVHVEFDVDLPSFQVSVDAPRAGELARTSDGKVLLAAEIDTHFRRAGWFNVATGAHEDVRGIPVIRFQTWRVVHRRDNTKIGLFERAVRRPAITASWE